MEPFLVKSSAFPEDSSGDVLKKSTKFAKFTGVKRRCWSLFFIKLPAEEQ